MGLLSSLNKLIGFSDPIKMPMQSPDLTNQMNLLREMIANYQRNTGDRYYDIARSRISNDAYLQAQQMGQNLNRAMNKRGVLNSGLTAQGQAQVQSAAQQGLQQALSNLEAKRVQDLERRRAQAINWFTNLLNMQTAQDQFNRQMAYRTQLGNMQAQNWFTNLLGDLGGGIGTLIAYKYNPLYRLFGATGGGYNPTSVGFGNYAYDNNGTFNLVNNNPLFKF